MKMKKMVGALALTAALAMGTTPAFAAGTSVGNDALFNGSNTNTDLATGNTVVNGMPINSQLICSVPIDITVVVPTDGGDLICPTSTAYRIQNRSTNNVKVIGAELQDGGFTVDPDASMATAEDSAGNGKYITMIATTTDGTLNLCKKPSGGTAMAEPSQMQTWTIPGGSATAPTDYGIALSGATNSLGAKPLTSGSLTSNMCKIVYTITCDAAAGAL